MLGSGFSSRVYAPAANSKTLVLEDQTLVVEV